MKEYDFYAVADRVQLTDERTALENLKRLLPDYRQYKSFYEFWKECTKRAERNNALLFVPLSLLKEYENEREAFVINYAIVRLLKSLADFEYFIQLGIDYTELDKVEQCIIAAAEYLSKSQEFLYFDLEYIMHIRYRMDFHHVKDIYIIDVDGHLYAKVPTLIDDIDTFRFELQIDDYAIPEQLTEQVLSCLHTKYREWALTQFVTEDDRCFLNNTFSIYVPPEYLELPKSKSGWYSYNPIEYFSQGSKSAFQAFNQLLSFLYDTFSFDDKKLFPFKNN